MWFYQYKIKVVVEDEKTDRYQYKEVIRNGVVPVPTNTYMEAIKNLVNYYGDDNIANILCLKAAFEGDVFEFENANDEPNFDYKVVKKGE